MQGLHDEYTRLLSIRNLRTRDIKAWAIRSRNYGTKLMSRGHFTACKARQGLKLWNRLIDLYTRCVDYDSEKLRVFVFQKQKFEKTTFKILGFYNEPRIYRLATSDRCDVCFEDSMSVYQCVRCVFKHCSVCHHHILWKCPGCRLE